MNWVVAREDLDPSLVADVVNILGGTGVSLEAAHEMAAQIDLSALSDAPIPLHPGTEAALGATR